MLTYDIAYLFLAFFVQPSLVLTQHPPWLTRLCTSTLHLSCAHFYRWNRELSLIWALCLIYVCQMENFLPFPASIMNCIVVIVFYVLLCVVSKHCHQVYTGWKNQRRLSGKFSSFDFVTCSTIVLHRLYLKSLRLCMLCSLLPNSNSRLKLSVLFLFSSAFLYHSECLTRWSTLPPLYVCHGESTRILWPVRKVRELQHEIEKFHFAWLLRDYDYFWWFASFCWEIDWLSFSVLSNVNFPTSIIYSFAFLLSVVGSW